MKESNWARMKRLAYQRGYVDGRFDAFEAWESGTVTIQERIQHRTIKGMRDFCESAILNASGIDPEVSP